MGQGETRQKKTSEKDRSATNKIKKGGGRRSRHPYLNKTKAKQGYKEEETNLSGLASKKERRDSPTYRSARKNVERKRFEGV